MYFHLLAFICVGLISATNAYSTGHSFDVAKDYKVCENSAANVSPVESVGDYGEYLSRLLKNLSGNGGGTVHLKSGTFKIKSPIIIPNRTCLVGAGMDDSTIAAHKDYLLPAIVSNFTYRISVRNLQIEMPTNGPKSGIEIKTSNIIWVKWVRVRNGKHLYLVHIHGGTRKYSKHALLEGVESDSTIGFGISFNRVKHATVRWSTILSSAMHSIDVVSSSNILIKRNLIVDAGAGGYMGSCGAVFLRSKHISMIGNRLVNARHAAACIWDSKHVDIKRTIVSNNRYTDSQCFESADSDDVKIENSVCTARPLGFEPKCKGIRSKDVCCPAKCKYCEESECIGGDEKCCPAAIRTSKKKCKSSGKNPPCVLYA